MKYLLIGVPLFILGFMIVSALLNKGAQKEDKPPLARDPRLKQDDPPQE